MSFQPTPIDGGFQSVYDTANGKTYYVEDSLWPANYATLTQTEVSNLAEFILTHAGEWVKTSEPTHTVLEGYIAWRAGVENVSETCPPEVQAALDNLNAAFAAAWPQ